MAYPTYLMDLDVSEFPHNRETEEDCLTDYFKSITISVNLITNPWKDFMIDHLEKGKLTLQRLHTGTAHHDKVSYGESDIRLREMN